MSCWVLLRFSERLEVMCVQFIPPCVLFSQMAVRSIVAVMVELRLVVSTWEPMSSRCWRSVMLHQWDGPGAMFLLVFRSAFNVSGCGGKSCETNVRVGAINVL